MAESTSPDSPGAAPYKRERFDLAGGRVNRLRLDRDAADLEARSDRRGFRRKMFFALEVLAVLYLLFLLAAFVTLFLNVERILSISNPSAFVFLGVCLGLFSAVPLSLALTLRHLATDAAEVDDKKEILDFNPAQLALLKSIVDLVKSAGPR